MVLSNRRFTTNKTYEEEKAERDAMIVQVKYATIENAYHKLQDSSDALRVFYPGADWCRRKGMAALMDEIANAGERLMVVIRAVGNPDREDLQDEYRKSLMRE